VNILIRLWQRFRDSVAESRGIQFDDPLQDFTPRARIALSLAARESERLRHGFIGTEHLVVGLLELGQGVAFNALRRSGMDVQTARLEIERLVGFGPDQPARVWPPFTPRLKSVLKLAHEERAALRHNYLGTEHLLLGILKEGGGVAARVLKSRNLDLDHTRQEILRELDPTRTPER
jgi:ATP-dependent Clp protease ATP-binding subunit ClpC